MARTPRVDVSAAGSGTHPHADTTQDTSHDVGQAQTVGSSLGGSVDDRTQPRADNTNDLPTGEMVGEYRIEKRIGQGGMGTVYGAVHPLIGKRAAIKVLNRALCMQPEAVERFITEARSVNQIGHPNIVDVFSFGNLADGRSYFAMEWLEGKSLAERLRDGRPALADTCAILEQVAEALEAAHDKRIVHRDLKPDNIFLATAPGGKTNVTLLDFGIAKLLDDSSERITKTRTGSMMGTPLYVAPEQARGYEIDARVDIYSLGAVAFEMVTGKPPFIADNAMDVVSMHLHEEPPRASSKVSGVPPALDDVLHTMLAKEPDGRPTLAKFREVLAAKPVVDVEAAPVVARSASNRTPWIAAAGILAVGGAIAAYVMMSSGGGDAKPAAPLAPPAGAEVSTPVVPVATEPPPPSTAPPPAIGERPAEIVAQAPLGTGTLTIRLDARGAEMTVDGEPVTLKKGEATLQLPPGLHRASISAPKHHAKVIEFTIEPGKTLGLAPDLMRKDRGPPDPEPGRRDHDDDGLSAGSAGASAGSATQSGASGSGSGAIDKDVVKNPFKRPQ